ncbi:MAG: response regulator transcription factor [Ginsengibacter sp.]
MLYNINIVIAANDCFISRGLVAALNEQQRFSVSAQAADFTELCTHVTTFSPDVIILESGLKGLTASGGLQTLSDQTNAAIILHEQSISGLHVEYYISKSVQGIVCREQHERVLIEAIYEVYNGNYYYGPKMKFFLESYPVYGKPNKPVFSAKERQVLQYITQNKTNKEIACLLYSSKYTIESIRKRMMAKTGTKSTAALLYFVFRNSIITLSGIILPWLSFIFCNLADICDFA